MTIVEGSSFCVSDRAGDISPQRPQGVFFLDTRIVSTWKLTVDGAPLDSLAVIPQEPFAVTFVGRAAARPGVHDSPLVITRRRMVATGLREDITVHNHGQEPAGCSLVLNVDGDFADLFDVKDARPATRLEVHRHDGSQEVWLSVDLGGRQRGVRVRAVEASVVSGGLAFTAVIPAQGTWTTTVEVLPSTDGQEHASSFPLDMPVTDTNPVIRMASWRAASPRVTTDSTALRAALHRSVVDLGALRIADPERPGADVVAAGAPWFMALFGRDSLLTGWMALPFDPGLAAGTLHTLAAHQGRRADPMSEEEPGRILHEVRLGVDPSRALGGSQIYYGSVDATPLFVVLLDEAVRWGLDLDSVRVLLPAADQALSWITEYGDLDGDGFVEYQRKTDRGLLNQGWKDSEDSVNFADGRPARGPIALCEVQAYVYAAYRARAHLAEVLGDTSAAHAWHRRATALRAVFDEAFWMPDRGYYAMALDGNKQQVDSLTSNVGHCLWGGIALPERAGDLAGHLLGRDMFTGWGVRTLAASMPTYNPVSYHNGSVWPHDSALIANGLARYGQHDAAATIAGGLIDAAAAFGGRLPELFCGFDRSSMPIPVAYPTSCSPQAWAAATPIGLLRAALNLRVCAAHQYAAAESHLPTEWGRLALDGLPLAGHRVNIDSFTRPAFELAGELSGDPVPCCAPPVEDQTPDPLLRPHTPHDGATGDDTTHDDAPAEDSDAPAAPGKKPRDHKRQSQRKSGTSKKGGKAE
ncbi:MAG TPA: glycogen debranching N-terminal domain-containing protein [Kineosporiaceae bacterium]|nr:glycogen debranching N-terminal domain-containing protein [Kineosporiaceae bacterium]